MAAGPVTPHAFVLFLWLRSPEPLTSQEAGPAVWGGAAPTQSLMAGSPGAAHEGAPRQAVAFSEPAWKVLLSAAAPSSPPGGESGRGGVAQGTSTSQWDTRASPSWPAQVLRLRIATGQEHCPLFCLVLLFPRSRSSHLWVCSCVFTDGLVIGW